jgi:hypothetical protein
MSLPICTFIFFYGTAVDSKTSAAYSDNNLKSLSNPEEKGILVRIQQEDSKVFYGMSMMELPQADRD